MSKELDVFPFTWKCPFCKNHGVVVVREDEYEAFRSGVVIQIAMPSLSDSEREKILTSICDPCYESTMPDDDEEGYDDLPDNYPDC